VVVARQTRYASCPCRLQSADSANQRTVARGRGRCCDKQCRGDFVVAAVVDSLRELNGAFNTKFIERNDEKSQHVAVDCRAIRKASLEDVRLLLNVLGTKMALEGESVYGAPFEAMKELLDFYRTSLAIRRGRNAAEEEKKESESDVDVPAESETL